MFNIGVIGCGEWSNRVFDYLRLYGPANHMERIKPHLWDSDRRNKREFSAVSMANKFDGEVYNCSLEMFIQNPELDAIYIATPHKTHFTHAFRALSYGVPVLIEKPLAVTINQAKILADYAEARDIKASVAENFRFFSSVRYAKEHVLPGLPHPSLTFFESWPMKQQGWRSDPEMVGGGLFIDGGIHKVSVSRYLLGEVLDMKATALEESVKDVPDGGVAVKLTHENGTSYIVHSRQGDDRSVPATRFICGDQVVTWPEVFGEGVPALWEAFMDYIRGKAPNPMPLWQGLQDLKVVIHTYQEVGDWLV